MWARLAPNEIQPISGEFTKFRVRDDDYGGTTHYEHAKFTIVAEKPEELHALPPYDYVLPNSEYNARFSGTLRKAESPDATFVLESGPCPFRVGADGTATLPGTETTDKAGTTSTQDEGDVQWGPAGQSESSLIRVCHRRDQAVDCEMRLNRVLLHLKSGKRLGLGANRQTFESIHLVKVEFRRDVRIFCKKIATRPTYILNTIRPLTRRSFRA